MKRKSSDCKTASRRTRRKGASQQHSINTQTHPDAAGIDVGAEEFVVAHKIARIIYAMITNQQSYNEETAFKLTPRNRERQLLKLEKQAAQFGFKIVALA